MTDESNDIMISLFYMVIAVTAGITVLLKQFVKFRGNIIVLLDGLGVSGNQ